VTADAIPPPPFLVAAEHRLWDDLLFPFREFLGPTSPPRRLSDDVPEDEGEQLLLF